MFESSVSYSATPVSGVDAVLESKTVGAVHHSLMRAREAAQRVDKDIDIKNRILMDNFTSVIQQFTNILQAWKTTVSYSQGLIRGLHRELQIRYEFHLKAGLEKMKYVLEHDFIRDWRLAEKDGVGQVAESFQGVLDSLDRVVEFASRASSLPAAREAAWFFVESALLNRKELAERAVHNITAVYTTFKSGRKLDEAAKNHEASSIAWGVLIGDDLHRAEICHYEMLKQLRSLVDNLETLLSMGNAFINITLLNRQALARGQVARTKFAEAVRGLSTTVAQVHG